VNEHTYGVAELAGVLDRVVAHTFPDEVWVRGQIRNLSRSAAGHVYFDLAEPGPAGANPMALVPITLFAGDKPTVNEVMRRAGAGRMTDGVEVRLRGRLRWYAARGRLQLRMSAIDPTYTLGRLLEDRDRLLARLRADGLLERNRGHALPLVPLRVGLVTSVGSAAHADFLHELEASGFGFRVTVADARTQGVDAGRSVAAAVARLVTERVDVVALVRGGGSRTDLAPFDGEVIARAVAAAGVPVLTGIGHEVDRSVADEVAHTACKTPTACASALVERVAAALARFDAVWEAIQRRAATDLGAVDERLRAAAARVVRAGRADLARGDRALDDAARRLRREVDRALVGAGRRLDAVESQAKMLDPALALARGWSITRDGDGRIVRSARSVDAGGELITTLVDGTVRSRVEAAAGDGR
jgi:exodeoxyribonuclease VII large subunit